MPADKVDYCQESIVSLRNQLKQKQSATEDRTDFDEVLFCV